MNDGFKITIIIFYFMLLATFNYIINNKDCKLAFYYLKIFTGIILFKLGLLVFHPNICELVKSIYCKN